MKVNEVKPETEHVVVGVYGTLKKGHYNHDLLKHCEFIGTKEISHLKLYTLGGFPGVKQSDSPDDKVMMELYKVDMQTLEELDWLEGIPYLYRRFQTDNNIYFYMFNHNVDEENRIEVW